MVVLNGELKEKVYVSQTEGFVDQDNPSHVYKLKKSLYGLKQAPRTWYDMLSSFLISHHFSKGVVDPTLFTRKPRNDLLMLQIYVDDIIFGSINTALCNEFDNLMTTKFKMSMMGQMSLFLGLQISQSSKGIFLNQSKYALEIIKKYSLLSSDSMDTPMVENGILELYFVLTEYQLADIFTKPLPRERFNFLIEKLSMRTVILKKLPEKLKDPGKLLIPYGFNELKCKALADLGASFNLMPLSVWKKLGLPKLISTRMTFKLANWAICTPAGIARDVFVPVGNFTFPANFFIVDYKSDPRVPLILGRPFLRTARALIDVHGEEMILRDGDERLTLNIRHDTSRYFNQPQKESINLINVFNDSSEDFLENLFSTNQPSGNPTFSSHPTLTSPEVKNDFFNPEGGNEFADELALITFPLGNEDLLFDIKSNLKEIEYLLHHDLIKDIDSILKDSIDQSNLADLNDNLVDSMPKMFTDEHALDYSSPPLYDEYDDDLFEVESDTEYVYDDPFDSKGDKIKESKLLINELNLPNDFLFSSEYESFLSEDFSEVDALPSTNNEDKVFNLGILIQENLFEVITLVAPEQIKKKLGISHASLILEDFDPPLYELPCFKEVLDAETLLLFSSENEEKVFKPGILNSKEVHSSLILELSHQGYKVFKINQILKSPMKNFLFSCGENIHILDVPCLYFYPP
uniref:Uncharacterized mitochondrial protein AtMg00810-like n=1 Tax=Tanacetum cinerariifolium TaxID=118510 RepID=A0A6L2KG62_TANCI|nr:uncharacterized mitochondrial protein AtMg00810-like [Tanacetum cinerariifolium]